MHRASGLSVYFSFNQSHFAPQKHSVILKLIEKAAQEGEPIFGQHSGRPMCNLMGLMSVRNPFWERPSYKLIADLPLPERVSRLRDPGFRQRLLSEEPQYTQIYSRTYAEDFEHKFRLGDTIDYEPPPAKSRSRRLRGANARPSTLKRSRSISCWSATGTSSFLPC